MIVWLNGAFGVGKTSVARELVRLIPEARLSDPERIGFVMRRRFWRKVDYQDVPLWRRLTRHRIARAARRGTVVVPMTIVRSDIFQELTDDARTFLLTASRTTLERRIAGSDAARQWRADNLDRCLEAFGAGPFGEPILTDGLTPAEIAGAILERLSTTHS